MTEKHWDEEDWPAIAKAVNEERKTWSNQQLLDELQALPPMPDEDDQLWVYSQTWYNAEIYLAQVNEAIERNLEESIPYFYEQASFGDPGEILRGVFKNGLSQIVSGDKAKFIKYALDAYDSPRAGTRYWSVHNLGYFTNDPHVTQTLRAALRDPEKIIRTMAEEALTEYT